MTTFLRATLEDGTQVISEFSKLARVGRYAAQVMAGQKALNVWRPVATQHPASGEPVLIRTRTLINGRLVRSLEQVQPAVVDHGYDPNGFEPVPEMARGRYGTWVCPSPVPEGAPAGLVPGAEYPIHRDVTGWGDRYVIVRVAQGEEEGQDEVRYLFEQHGVSSAGMPAGHGEEEVTEGGEDDGGFGDDDDE
jgi:hypothetical protein